MVTKIDDIEAPPGSASDAERRVHYRRAVDASVFCSCRELRRFYLPVVLAGHSIEAYRNKMLWGRLLELQADGVLHKLGVSCCSPDEALEVLEDPLVEHIQIPFNLLDWRWRDERVQQRLKERLDVTVHARSIFLQGLLLSPATVYPEVEGVEADIIVGTLERLAERLGCANRKQLVLAYCLSEQHRWIHTFLLGIVTMGQLQENLADLQVRAPLTQEECHIVEEEVGCLQESGCLPDALLNPHLWPKRNVLSPVPAANTQENENQLPPAPKESCTCLAQSNNVACICGMDQHCTSLAPSCPGISLYVGNPPLGSTASTEQSLAKLIQEAELDVYQVYFQNLPGPSYLG